MIQVRYSSAPILSTSALAVGQAIVLSLLSFASAQDKPPTSPDTPTFLKLCGHNNPRPCIDKPPVVTHRVDPEYSSEGRKAKVQGIVVLETVVGTDGLAHDARIARPLGHGLDEEAIKALKGWRFKPAMSEGNPVPAKINIEVGFRNP